MQVKKKLDNIEYFFFSDSSEIRDYVNKVAKEEWDPHDFEIYSDDLEQSVWQLEEINVSDIIFGPSQPEESELGPRIQHQIKLAEEGVSIPPLILRGSDLLIFDGYARTNMFRKNGIIKCLAYVGRRG